MRSGSTLIISMACVIPAGMYTAEAADEPPYPPSPVIAGLNFDWSTHRRDAQGSDNFQLTWADDGHQYGWWGDGGGFGGTNNDGRVGLGFARIEGQADNWKGFNVWGGKDAEHPARFDGKSWGTISVDGVFYSWIIPDVPDTGGPRDHYRYIELARSTDRGATWTKADWRWRIEDNLIVPTFVNCGRNNEAARDDYVYSYFIRPERADITHSSFGLNVQQPGAVFLARVHKGRIFEGHDQYEWFTGLGENAPAWGRLDEKQPVFEDPNGTGWCLSAIYNPGLERILLCTEHTRSHESLMGLFDAPEPWGPWTTVKYWTPEDRFGEKRPGSDLDWNFNVFFLAFAPKWFGADGWQYALTFTGGGKGRDNDSFNVVHGRFEPRTPPTIPAQPPRADVVEQQAAADVWPSLGWLSAEPAEAELDTAGLQQAESYALSAGGSGMIVRYGRVVRRWGDQKQRYDIKSATKSFGATMLGVALKDGKLDLDAPARRYHPALGTPPDDNAKTGWLDEITIRHLATQTAGFEKPGGYQPLLFRPGTQWHYSDGGPNWLAECITLQYQRDLEELMFERVFTPLGITRDDLHWRQNSYRPHEIEGVPRREFGAGIHANVDALSRLGYLYLRRGRWHDQQILPEEFVQMASRPVDAVIGLPEFDPETHGNASDHYSLLWWNNGDGALPNVPRDTFWAWGLHDSLVVVIPSLDLVVVRGGERGKSWPRGADRTRHYDVLKPFLEPIVAAAETARTQEVSSQPAEAHAAPYPRSRVITGIEWASGESIIRLAEGSDNWPLTWADDDHLYTAYGDGWGFEPKTPMKLSLGLARLEGVPPEVRGVNIRSADAEHVGQGAAGRKASGMLMVSGTLYLWARNAENSQLAWSADHGRTWTWVDWKWTTSFGCPTFLQFGRNYAGARDEFVYVYSHDSDSAYDAADAMVLARVPRDRITERAAYQFFSELSADGRPHWTSDIGQRGPVFRHSGRCYRSGISYNAALQRYLWCQVLPESTDSRGPRFQGGFGIYDAPQPWGPWTSVFFTNEWDVGPGETSSIPTKWMSADGRAVHLVFSGDDCFSIRSAQLKLAD